MVVDQLPREADSEDGYQLTHLSVSILRGLIARTQWTRRDHRASVITCTCRRPTGSLTGEAVYNRLTSSSSSLCNETDSDRSLQLSFFIPASLHILWTRRTKFYQQFYTRYDKNTAVYIMRTRYWNSQKKNMTSLAR